MNEHNDCPLVSGRIPPWKPVNQRPDYCEAEEMKEVLLPTTESIIYLFLQLFY